MDPRLANPCEAELSDIQAKRTAIKQQYPNSPHWHEKVDKMPDSQVLAVHSRLMRKASDQIKRQKAQTKKRK